MSPLSSLFLGMLAGYAYTLIWGWNPHKTKTANIEKSANYIIYGTISGLAFLLFLFVLIGITL